MVVLSADLLAEALETVPGVPQAMVERARAGYYDAGMSPLDAPAVQLRADLRALGTGAATPRASRPWLLALAAAVAGENDRWPVAQMERALLS
jgi:hypothetical protein